MKPFKFYITKIFKITCSLFRESFFVQFPFINFVDCSWIDLYKKKKNTERYSFVNKNKIQFQHVNENKVQFRI